MHQKLAFMLTYVYSFNVKEERRDFWSTLQTTLYSNTKPWLILGDFNSILHLEDRLGGNPISWTKIVDFSTCVENSGLMELPHQGVDKPRVIKEVWRESILKLIEL